MTETILFPLVSLIDDGKLYVLQVRACDWCGHLLPEHYEFEDDAVRVMYFCSKECHDGFNAKYPKGIGTWPGIKLSVRGLFVRLKDYEG